MQIGIVSKCRGGLVQRMPWGRAEGLRNRGHCALLSGGAETRGVQRLAVSKTPRPGFWALCAVLAMKGGRVLILGVQRLAVLETPKTGSLALRAMLLPYTVPPHALPLPNEAARHVGHRGFVQKYAAPLAQAFGDALETVAVVRAPLERMQSWYRYRMRPRVADLPVSTRGTSFDAFMQAYLAGTGSQMANLGRQDRFVGWTGRAARVDHVFAYDRLDLLEAFLSARTGDVLTLPMRNMSPLSDGIDYALSEAVLARYHAANAKEFALYAAVSKTGYLQRAGLG